MRLKQPSGEISVKELIELLEQIKDKDLYVYYHYYDNDNFPFSEKPVEYYEIEDNKVILY